MRKRVFLLLMGCGLLVLATSAPVLAGGKTHDVKTEIVSVDLKAKTITIKDEDGEDKTVPVFPEAVASLNSIKAGDHVTLTCRDSENGEHEGVAAIKVERDKDKDNG